MKVQCSAGGLSNIVECRWGGGFVEPEKVADGMGSTSVSALRLLDRTPVAQVLSVK